MVISSRIQARRQLGGDDVADILNPIRGIRDEIRRMGGIPKDHARENRKRIKEIQEALRLRKLEEEAEQQAAQYLFKLQRFEENSAPKVDSGKRTSHAALAGAPTLPQTPQGRDKNYIRQNAIAAAKAVKRQPPIVEVDNTPPRLVRNGQLPAYLIERKAQWAKAEEDRIARLSNSYVPAGCHLLQPHHRLQALTTLHQARELLLIELRRLPVILDTLSSQKRKQNIEMRLQEVENGISLYERERVVVHDGWEEEAGIFELTQEVPPQVDAQSVLSFGVPPSDGFVVEPQQQVAPIVHLADASLPHLPLEQDILRAQQSEEEQQALYRAQYDAIASQARLFDSSPNLLHHLETNPQPVVEPSPKPRKKNWSAPSPEFLPTADPFEGAPHYTPSYDALSTAPSDILGVPLAI